MEFLDFVQIIIGGFLLGFVVTLSFYYHPLDRLRRGLYNARIDHLRSELRRPRGDGGRYLRMTALKLGPSAVPLITEHLESRRDRYYLAGRDLDVDVLLDIVGLDAVADLVSQMNNSCPIIIDGLVRRFGGAAIPALHRLYTDRRPDVRKCVVLGLDQVGDEGGVACLIEAARDSDAHVRLEAVAGLARKLARAPAFVESALIVFAENLQHENPMVRAKAISGISQVQKIAPASIRSAIPLLSNLLNDPTAPTRRETAAVLAEVGEPALDELIMACRNDDAEVGRVALNGIARIGMPARGAFPVVLEDLTHDSAALRSASVDVLRAIGAMDDPIVIDTAIDRLDNETDFNVAEKLAVALTGVQRATEAIEKCRQRRASHEREQAEREQAERGIEAGEGGGSRDDSERTDPCHLGPEHHYEGIMGGY